MSETDFEMETGVDLDATTDVHLTDPATGEPWYDDAGERVIVKVISSDSAEFERALHEIGGRVAIRRKNNAGALKGRLTFEQEKQFQAEVYAAVIRGWHLTKKNGGPALDVKYTKQNAINWAKANPLFAKQLGGSSDELTNFAKDLGENFTPKGSAPSAKASKPKSD